MYANIYVLAHRGVTPPLLSDVENNAVWIGTSGSGYDGMRNTFVVEEGVVLRIPLASNIVEEGAGGASVLSLGSGKMRFYMQGVTEEGEVLDWTRCVFVDA